MDSQKLLEEINKRVDEQAEKFKDFIIEHVKKAVEEEQKEDEFELPVEFQSLSNWSEYIDGNTTPQARVGCYHLNFHLDRPTVYAKFKLQWIADQFNDLNKGDIVVFLRYNHDDYKWISCETSFNRAGQIIFNSIKSGLKAIEIMGSDMEYLK